MKVSLFPLRKSVRRYSDKNIEKAKLDQLLEFSRKLPALRKNISHELIYVQDKNWVADTLHSCLLSYGRIIAAPCLLLPFYEDTKESLFEMGFQVEHIVLKATELELSTCWITVEEAEIKKHVLKARADPDIAGNLFVSPIPERLDANLDNKKLHNVILIGYPSTKRMDRVLNNAIRRECKANARKPIESIITNKKNKKIPTILQKILEHSILAPSSRNRQPWRIRLTDYGFDLGYFSSNRIDLGIFLAHLKIATEHYGKKFRFKQLDEKTKEVEWFGAFTLK